MTDAELEKAVAEYVNSQNVDERWLVKRLRLAFLAGAQFGLEEAKKAVIEYRPPIETVCAHGKIVGPCPMCSAEHDREQREARRT